MGVCMRLGRGRFLMWLVVFAGGASFAASVESGSVFDAGRNLSPQDTVAQSHDYMTKMQATFSHINKLADAAKKQKDVIKLN